MMRSVNNKGPPKGGLTDMKAKIVVASYAFTTLFLTLLAGVIA